MGAQRFWLELQDLAEPTVFGKEFSNMTRSHGDELTHRLLSVCSGRTVLSCLQGLVEGSKVK